MIMITLDQTLDAVLQLPIEQQTMLLEILYKRQIEASRKEIAGNAKTSISAFRNGQLKPQPLPDIIADLRLSLEEGE